MSLHQPELAHEIDSDYLDVSEVVEIIGNDEPVASTDNSAQPVANTFFFLIMFVCRMHNNAIRGSIFVITVTTSKSFHVLRD